MLPVFGIALLAPLVLLFTALIALTVLTHRNVQTGNDPARIAAVPSLRHTLHVFLGATLLDIIACALLVAYSISYAYGNSYSATNHISAVGSFLMLLASTGLLTTIAHLATGVRHAASGGTYTSRKLHRAITYLTLFAVLCFVVYFIYRQVAWSMGRRYGMAGYVLAIIVLVALALLFIAAATVFVYSIKGHKQMKSMGAGSDYVRIGKKVAIIAGLNLIIFGWMIVSFVLGFGIGYDAGFWMIIDLVIWKVGMFALLVWIYFIGKKGAGGLWSAGGGLCVPEVEEQAGYA